MHFLLLLLIIGLAACEAEMLAPDQRPLILVDRGHNNWLERVPGTVQRRRFYQENAGRRSDRPDWQCVSAGRQ